MISRSNLAINQDWLWIWFFCGLLLVNNGFLVVLWWPCRICLPAGAVVTVWWGWKWHCGETTKHYQFLHGIIIKITNKPTWSKKNPMKPTVTSKHCNIAMCRRLFRSDGVVVPFWKRWYQRSAPGKETVGIFLMVSWFSFWIFSSCLCFFFPIFFAYLFLLSVYTLFFFFSFVFLSSFLILRFARVRNGKGLVEALSNQRYKTRK